MQHTYLPRYHLYPTNPQILHHLVLELFVRCPQYSRDSDAFFSLVPSGPIYKYGGALADQWKQIFQSHPHYTTLVLIAFADLPPDIAGVSTTDTKFHSFFGVIDVVTDMVSGLTSSAELFALYAKSIEAQLPFIRAYKHRDNLAPYIININKDQLVFEEILDVIQSYHGDNACYVFVQPDAGVEKIMHYLEKQD